MTYLIRHRINCSEELSKINKEFGVEIDLRSDYKSIYLSHDPFTKGESFSSWIKYFNHKILILNIKEEGIENEIIKILKKNKISNYFFLDQSLPMLTYFSKKNIKETAVRFSEKEPIELVSNFIGKCNWVWIDLTTNIEIDIKVLEILKNKRFKTCLASPDLRKTSNLNKLSKTIEIVKNNPILIDAVCTKNTSLWL